MGRTVQCTLRPDAEGDRGGPLVANGEQERNYRGLRPPRCVVSRPGLQGGIESGVGPGEACVTRGTRPTRAWGGGSLHTHFAGPTADRAAVRACLRFRAQLLF